MTETLVQETWWGSGADNSNRTPTAATFMQVDESVTQSSADGFISLMDSHSFSVGSQQETSGFSLQEDEDDDLGLRNSKPKPIELELDPKERESSTPVPKSEPVIPPKAGEDNDLYDSLYFDSFSEFYRSTATSGWRFLARSVVEER